VDGRHETFDDLVLVIHDFCKGCEAVCSARCIGDLSGGEKRTTTGNATTYNILLGLILVLVYPNDIHGCVSRGRGDDNFLRASFQMKFGPEQKLERGSIVKGGNGSTVLCE
jgi:hypothetical protein